MFLSKLHFNLLKPTLLSCVGIALSATSASACIKQYEAAFKESLHHSGYRSLKKKNSHLEKVETLSSKIYNYPSNRFDAYAWRIKHAHSFKDKILPGFAAITVPILATPWTNLSSAVLTTLAPVALEAKEKLDLLRTPRSVRKKGQLYDFISDLDRLHQYSFNDGPALSKAIKKMLHRGWFQNREEAERDLRDAYRYNYFCQSDSTGQTTLMSMEDILRSVEAGDLQKFAEDHRVSRVQD